MIPDNYIPALKSFVVEEVKMIKAYPGIGKFYKPDGYYETMYDYVSAKLEEFILFKKSGVNFIEMEFAESVKKIKDKLISLAGTNNIPYEILFIPRIKITERHWESIIHNKVAELIRIIFDNETDEDFQTLRLYKLIERNSPLARWTKSKNGRNFLFEFQISEGVRQESLIKKRLYLFDRSFVYAQMQYTSSKIWIHKVVVEAFQNWENDNKLWKSIDHLKRKIQTREIYDESRLEIKFLRLLEINGYSKRFIHDENISWLVKYRPDFWFTKENLIIEYDEKAHLSQIQEDIQREKIIRRYFPNVNFIRVQEGFEENGLNEIKHYLMRFENKYENLNDTSRIFKKELPNSCSANGKSVARKL